MTNLSKEPAPAHNLQVERPELIPGITQRRPPCQPSAAGIATDAAKVRCFKGPDQITDLVARQYRRRHDHAAHLSRPHLVQHVDPRARLPGVSETNP